MNVVGLAVILLSIIPVYLANRLSQDPVGAPGAARRASRKETQRSRRKTRP